MFSNPINLTGVGVFQRAVEWNSSMVALEPCMMAVHLDENIIFSGREYHTINNYIFLSKKIHPLF